MIKPGISPAGRAPRLDAHLPLPQSSAFRLFLGSFFDGRPGLQQLPD
jgi:hypothetical protein